MSELVISHRKAWVRPDVIAGLTTAAVMIPKAMAYATIAGPPVQVGLYTGLFGPSALVRGEAVENVRFDSPSTGIGPNDL